MTTQCKRLNICACLQSVFSRNVSRAGKPETSRAPLAASFGTALSEDESDASEGSQVDTLADVGIPALDSDFGEDDEEDDEGHDDIAEQQVPCLLARLWYGPCHAQLAAAIVARSM